MSFQTDLRDAIADGVKAAHDAFGETASYTNRDQVAVTGLSIRAGRETSEFKKYQGLEVEVVGRQFEIARQTSFPPSNGIQVGDAITFDSKVYRVDAWEDMTGGIEAAFRIQTSRTVPKKAGLGE